MRGTFGEAFAATLKHVAAYECRAGEEYIFGIAASELPVNAKRMGRDAVMPVYRKEFWEAINADNLPSGVDVLLFDIAVELGVAQAIQCLRGVLRLKGADGVDKSVLTAVNAYVGRYGLSGLVGALSKARRFHHSRGVPELLKICDAALQRNNAVTELAHRCAQAAAGTRVR